MADDFEFASAVWIMLLTRLLGDVQVSGWLAALDSGVVLPRGGHTSSPWGTPAMSSWPKEIC